jgi:hypothetical protein
MALARCCQNRATRLRQGKSGVSDFDMALEDTETFQSSVQCNVVTYVGQSEYQE